MDALRFIVRRLRAVTAVVAIYALAFPGLFGLPSISSLGAAVAPTTASQEWRCPVHGNWLRPEWADVSFGLPLPPLPAYVIASRTLFPRAGGRIQAGCVPTGPRHRIGWFCRACRAAKLDWARDHPDDGKRS